jgi:hypothetical protein
MDYEREFLAALAGFARQRPKLDGSPAALTTYT